MFVTWTFMLGEALAALTAGVSAGVMAPFSWLTMAGGPWLTPAPRPLAYTTGARGAASPVGIRFPPAWRKADLAAWTFMLWEALAAWTAGVSAGVMAPFSWLTMAGGPWL